jgi:HlyD family secretion protein
MEDKGSDCKTVHAGCFKTTGLIKKGGRAMSRLASPISNWRAAINRHKKWVIIGVIFFVVFGLAAASKFKAIPADKVQVVVTDVTSSAVEKGTVISEDSAIFSEVQGKVKAVYVKEGQAVQKGQLLAEIDIGDIDSRIAQLEGQLRATKGSEQAAGYQNGQNQIKQQQLAVEQAEIALNLSQTAFDRMQKLFNEGAVTLVELEQAKADLNTKKKSLEQANYNLKSIEGQSQGSKILYQGQRESILAQIQQLQAEKTKARIVAGSENVILIKDVEAGDYITPGRMLFSLGSKADLKVETYVGSSDTAYLKTGDEVTVTFKSPGQDIDVPGAINKIAPVAENIVSALGVSEPKIKISVSLESFPDELNVVPGAVVDVTFITKHHRNVLAIPKESLFSDNGKDYVWAVNNGIAVLKQVQKGPAGDDLTVIKGGLTKGEQVLLNPHQEDLKPGIRIK